MTREIKFRGMDVSGDWFIGNLTISHNDRPDGIEAGSYISSKDGAMPWAYEVRPETVGQFTGLHDKNGADIYEGDIVMADDGIIGHSNFEVYMNECRGGLRISDDDDYDNGDYYHGDVIRWNEVEVEGNIHENPELLEE